MIAGCKKYSYRTSSGQILTTQLVSGLTENVRSGCDCVGVVTGTLDVEVVLYSERHLSEQIDKQVKRQAAVSIASRLATAKFLLC